MVREVEGHRVPGSNPTKPDDRIRPGRAGYGESCQSGSGRGRQRRAGQPAPRWRSTSCSSTPAGSQLAGMVPLLITATGHGSRQKCNVNDLGFPVLQAQRREKGQGLSNRGSRARHGDHGHQTRQLRGPGARARQRMRLTFVPNGAGCRASAIASARRCIAAMATATKSACSMDRTPLPGRLRRNAPFLPRLKHGGILARFW